jgi:plasmid stability protein
MNTLTIQNVDAELHRKLAERAKANDRSLEDEALCCLQEVIELDEELLNAISPEQWDDVERTISETIEDQGTPLTASDFQRYREMARGGKR